MLKRKNSSLMIIGSLFLSIASFQNCAANDGSRSQSSVASAVTTPLTDVIPEIPAEPVAKVASETVYEPLLADRYYVTSVFNDVFGPRARLTDTAKLALDPVNFGSPCSIYEDYSYEIRGDVWARVEAMNTCALASQSYLSTGTNPTPQVARQAQIAHACSDLTSAEATMTYALGRISSEPLPLLTRGNVTAAFYLFYRNHGAPPDSLIDSLLLMAPLKGATRETWQNVLHTICISSHWQVL